MSQKERVGSRIEELAVYHMASYTNHSDLEEGRCSSALNTSQGFLVFRKSSNNPANRVVDRFRLPTELEEVCSGSSPIGSGGFR